ncbi:MAG: hypothetical protein A2Z12_01245 [Actinobacteria bacterium RBG_16_68_21]|nr:MAG: hypothetical protein A2Z12_01245 [Actinobacteria bacterium RBG_16_68_21]
MSSILFVTRAGCMLCAEARPLVETEAARRGHAFEVADIDRLDWQARWGDRVPVVLRDGVEVLSGRFTRRLIRRALR